MKNILIIGGCGYIGSAVVQKLRLKYKISIVDFNYYEHEIFNGIDIINTNAKLLDENFVQKFDVIISLGGNTSAKHSTNINSSLENNVENLKRIINLMNNDQMFIYASSSSVYGDTNNLVVDETYENSTHCNNYDFSKKVFDMHVEQILKTEPKKIYGLRFGSVNGFSPNFRNDMIVNSMVHNGLSKHEVQIFSKNTARPILGIADLCNAIEKILELGNSANSGIYNLASFNSTVNMIGEAVSSTLHVKLIDCDLLVDNIKTDILQTNTYNFLIDCTKFKTNFHFEFKDTIESIIQDIKKNYTSIVLNNARNSDRYSEHISNCKKINECRVCKSAHLTSIFNLDKQPLANSCHDNSFLCETYPLNLMVCNYCFHLQLDCVVDPTVLYKNYIYESGTSRTILNYFKSLFEKIENKTSCKKNKTIIEVASNDGTQLDFFKQAEWNTIGIDPAINLSKISSSKYHDIYCDFLNRSIMKKIKEKYGKIDVILCQNVFAHTHDIYEFIESCKICMDDETILYIQVSQANLVRDNQFDTIYHEHLSFFNINSMKHIIEQFGLFINNIEKPTIHGVSYLFEIGKIQSKSSNLISMLNEEIGIGLTNIETYFNYAKICNTKAMIFKTKILDYLSNGFTIIGYGASAKGNTILNYIKMSNNEVKYIIDDQKTKQGLYTPGSNIPICNKNILNNYDKLAILMISWNFKDEIIQKVEAVRGNKKTEYIFY